VKNSKQKCIYFLAQPNKHGQFQSSARSTNLRHGNGSNFLLQVMRVFR
jgi:hypothetical protein